MGWSLGVNSEGRDVGYSVPATCDHPGCETDIDRGISYVCGCAPEGGDHGCGLFFCGNHLSGGYNLCARCIKGEDSEGPFPAKPDVDVWVHHKLTDPSWEQWRVQNPEWVAQAKKKMENTMVPAMSVEDIEHAKELLAEIGPMHIVVTVWNGEGTSALKNKKTTEHIACDIEDDKPYAALMALLLNNAAYLLEKAK